MNKIAIRRARPADSVGFVELVKQLAEFEHLEPPPPDARRRLIADIFRNKKLGLFVASNGDELVGYALYFFTYSSFLGRPTLYLEDLFVREEYRAKGLGLRLFRRCVKEALSLKCGRMEWSVLTWNSKAIEFYERLGAKRMTDWYVYRLDSAALNKVGKLDA